MNLKHLFNADSGLSVLLHVLKALVGLLVNWMVLNAFAVDDFVVWSVTSSILLIATASDLGIGQYTVTQMINADRSGWPGLVGQALGALVPLGLLSGLFVFIAIDGPSLLYRLTMGLILALRVLALPFVAVLHAENQFKVRKAIELVAYLVAAVVVGAITLTGSHVYLALLALNATFLLGFALMVVAAGRYVSIYQSVREFSLGRSIEVFRAAIPFTVNNLTGLVTYGGFIWLSSLVLPSEEVAKLAILHSFILVNLYQVYDVFLKARQADLADAGRLPSYGKLNVLLMLALPPAFLLTGPLAIILLSGGRVEITAVQAALYGTFVAFELGNLFAQSVIQVNLALVARLKTYSAMRATMLIAFLPVALVSWPGEQAILALLGILLLGSIVTFMYLINGMKVGVQAAVPISAGLRPSQQSDR